jgi:hypothetical protein
MTKYRFSRAEDGTITVRAERIVGKQLVTSITKVIGPGEDISAAMKQLHQEVMSAGLPGRAAEGTASERRVAQ